MNDSGKSGGPPSDFDFGKLSSSAATHPGGSGDPGRKSRQPGFVEIFIGLVVVAGLIGGVIAFSNWKDSWKERRQKELFERAKEERNFPGATFSK